MNHEAIFFNKPKALPMTNLSVLIGIGSDSISVRLTSCPHASTSDIMTYRNIRKNKTRSLKTSVYILPETQTQQQFITRIDQKGPYCSKWRMDLSETVVLNAAEKLFSA